MALTVARVQDSRIALGPQLWQENFLLIPGVSDYVTGGYSLTPALFSMGKIQAIDVLNTNTTGLAWVGLALFTFNTWTLAQTGGISQTVGASGYTSANFWVGTAYGSSNQVSASTNLTGAIWEVMVYGY